MRRLRRLNRDNVHVLQVSDYGPGLALRVVALCTRADTTAGGVPCRQNGLPIAWSEALLMVTMLGQPLEQT